MGSFIQSFLIFTMLKTALLNYALRAGSYRKFNVYYTNNSYIKFTIKES